ncbi:MAG: protein-glutamate O-methyltransferase CheR [Lachnospiraceae bacterium]|nr:protein-glutamate O-methyltransferase CheR [Lachnospiraceae bacterium]
MGDYEVFKKKIFEITKIDLSSYKEQQMRRRIDALITKRHAQSYDEYVKMIASDKALLEEFVSYLTINVSEFYRNPEQWKILENEIIPMLRLKRSNLKIWSAACSTGDEPYSLVMLLNKMNALRGASITATDIDREILEKAKSGIYLNSSLKGLPTDFLDKNFTKINDKTYQIHQDVKNYVNFKQHNLLKDEYPKDLDLIICRNVMIYFTEEAKNIIYKKFYDSLREGGVLFVGSTEQIIKAQELGFKNLRSFFYQK